MQRMKAVQVAKPNAGLEVVERAMPEPAEGDGGQYGIMLQTLDSQGRPVGDALQLATTGDLLFSDDDGNLSLTPIAPPEVTVTLEGIVIVPALLPEPPNATKVMLPPLLPEWVLAEVSEVIAIPEPLTEPLRSI